MRITKEIQIRTALGEGRAEIFALDGVRADQLALIVAKNGSQLFGAISGNGDVSKLAAVLSPEDFAKVRALALSGVKIAVDGQFYDADRSYGELFAGYLWDGWGLIYEACKVHLGNFSGALLESAVNDLARAMNQLPKKITALTGESGDPSSKG